MIYTLLAVAWAWLLDRFTVVVDVRALQAEIERLWTLDNLEPFDG